MVEKFEHRKGKSALTASKGEPMQTSRNECSSQCYKVVKILGMIFGVSHLTHLWCRSRANTEQGSFPRNGLGEATVFWRLVYFGDHWLKVKPMVPLHFHFIAQI